MEGFNLTIILLLILILFSSMDFKHKIIQWNCRGLKPNYNEVSLLISEYNPSVFCFQETFLKPDDNISLKGFNVYNYVHTDCLRPYLQKDINCIEKIQRQAARFIKRDYRSREEGCVTNMLRDLELPSLQQRREFNKLVFLFKTAGGMVPAINSEDY